MKAFWFIVCVLVGGAAGFFLGQYYEANRDVTIEDIGHFKKRVSSRADKWAKDVGERLKDVIED